MPQLLPAAHGRVDLQNGGAKPRGCAVCEGSAPSTDARARQDSLQIHARARGRARARATHGPAHAPVNHVPSPARRVPRVKRMLRGEKRAARRPRAFPCGSRRPRKYARRKPQAEERANRRKALAVPITARCAEDAPRAARASFARGSAGARECRARARADWGRPRSSGRAVRGQVSEWPLEGRPRAARAAGAPPLSDGEARRVHRHHLVLDELTAEDDDRIELSARGQSARSDHARGTYRRSAPPCAGSPLFAYLTQRPRGGPRGAASPSSALGRERSPDGREALARPQHRRSLRCPQSNRSGAHVRPRLDPGAGSRRPFSLPSGSRHR